MEDIKIVEKILEEREPIFHNRKLTYDRKTVDNEMHKDYWEISASGNYYTRDFVLDFLENRYKNEEIDESVSENWKKLDFKCTHLGDDVYMVTYILDGQHRFTRRITLWKGNIKDGFKILYHQGTIILNSERISIN